MYKDWTAWYWLFLIRVPFFSSKAKAHPTVFRLFVSMNSFMSLDFFSSDFFIAVLISMDVKSSFSLALDSVSPLLLLNPLRWAMWYMARPNLYRSV
jgi:hypothetical protein